MRNFWIILYVLIAACSRVVEPLDVVVSQQPNRLELGDNPYSLDVTNTKITIPRNCCKK